MPKLKEYTINVDVAIIAKNEAEAVQKLSERVNCFKYWLGDVTEYKRGINK